MKLFEMEPFETLMAIWVKWCSLAIVIGSVFWLRPIFAVSHPWLTGGLLGLFVPIVFDHLLPRIRRHRRVR
jgi:hypothetical protein